jgi:RNA polymerase primary sigma factor
LIKAAQRFDETKGFKFISYGVWWIRQSILQALAEHARIVRLPLNKVGLKNRISRAYSQLEQEFEREPTPEELAFQLEMDVEEVSATLSISSRHLSMDSPLCEGEDSTLMDVLCNPNAESSDLKIEFKESLKKEIDRSLSALTHRQKDVIQYFFGIGIDHPMSLEDIGNHFHLTRERVRQIKDQAIVKLRSPARCDMLRAYMG